MQDMSDKLKVDETIKNLKDCIEYLSQLLVDINILNQMSFEHVLLMDRKNILLKEALVIFEDIKKFPIGNEKYANEKR
jgi:hypothetical protein